MDTDNKNITPEDSVDIDKIIEFYKDIEPDSNDTGSDTSKLETEKKPQSCFFGFKKKKEHGNINTEVYGLSQNGRLILYRAVSAAVCCLIIAGSFVLAYYLPGNESVIAENRDKLRAESEYQSLKNRYDTLKTEVENLKTANAEKKDKLDKVSDFDNSKAELRTQITAKTYELNELNSQIADKKSQIAALDESISQKAAPETVLPPGRYTVGKNIAAGKYLVTGSGKFMLATSAGKSKENITLGSEPVEITLEESDIIKFDGKVKFTFKN